MRKIQLIIAILFCIQSLSFAQTATDANSKKTSTKTLTKEGKPDMRLKANKVAVSSNKTTVTTSSSSTTTGMKKDGTPDMRIKANRTAAKNVTPASTSTSTKVSAPATTTTSTTVSKPVTRTTSVSNTTTSSTSTDKVISTDDKGRTIYEGPRGGHYYINKNGHKEYIKK